LAFASRPAMKPSNDTDMSKTILAIDGHSS
jgi:hypothetical protein